MASEHDRSPKREWVVISLETAECAASALRELNASDYYHHNGRSQRELEAAISEKAKRMRKYSYDSKCRDLADHFLVETVCTDADREELAQDIQDAVEGWFSEWERRNVPTDDPGRLVPHHGSGPASLPLTGNH